MKRWIYCFLILMTLSGCQTQRPTERLIYGQDPVSNYRQPSNEEIAYNNYSNKYAHKREQLIIIDAGHGGEDMGTSSKTTPKYQEKSLNLTTSQLLKDYLQKMGYSVKLTRSDDTFIPLATRAVIANYYNPKLFVSVHYNAAHTEKPEGVEVYYFQSDDDKARSYQSKVLAERVLEKVILKTGAKSRGIKHGNLAVIRETTMPAILIEGGFMTNKAEMEKIKDPAYIKQLALGIALGIDGYLSR